MDEALSVVESKRDNRGRWLLDVMYHDAQHVDLGEVRGRPSRWIKLSGLRVLGWAERA